MTRCLADNLWIWRCALPSSAVTDHIYVDTAELTFIIKRILYVHNLLEMTLPSWLRFSTFCKEISKADFLAGTRLLLLQEAQLTSLLVLV